MNDEKTTEETWREVGDQFKALGESLATAFRTAWEKEETREHVRGMKEGLEAMVDQVGRAIEEASASVEGQKMREELGRAAESARAAGEKTLQDARPHLISALDTVNAELQKLIRRMEGGEQAVEGSGVESASEETDTG
jgi:hypothetical protein